MTPLRRVLATSPVFGPLVIALAVIGVLTGLKLAPGGVSAEELRSGLVHSCEQNGEPLRVAVRTLLEEQIEQSRSLPPEFFPSIPPDQLHDLIHEQNQFRLHLLQSIQPVDCEAAYPR